MSIAIWIIKAWDIFESILVVKSKRYVLNLTLEFSIIIQYRQRVMYNKSKIIKGVYKDKEGVC